MISLENLTKSYEDLHVLGPISLNLKKNDFICVVGQSGCGKSTLWRILAGLEEPSTGELKLDGIDRDEDIGVVFQSHALLPWLSVRKNIELVYKIKGKKPEDDKISEVLEMVGIQDFADKKPKHLSGGMNQRVAIARALVEHPKILLMDEPFGALDALTRLNLQEDLIELWTGSDNEIVFFITHDIEEAVALATRVLILSPRPGKVIKEFEIDLPYPRDRTSESFIKKRAQISTELLNSIIRKQKSLGNEKKKSD